jgi:hypothetical protein
VAASGPLASITQRPAVESKQKAAQPTADDETFRRAIELMDAVYDAAAVHVLAERQGQGWVNRYTSVCYGRGRDMLSVPEAPDIAIADDLMCLRLLLSARGARAFVGAAIAGNAALGPHRFDYDLEVGITGFRPGGTFNEHVGRSYFGTSMWTRERVGRAKRIGVMDLFGDDLWRLSEEVAFLNETRWSPIPLLQHPEKLGDLDEWWPTPVELNSRNDAGLTVAIKRDILDIADERITINGWLISEGLLVGTMTLRGRGPHRVEVDADGADLTLFVDGIPFDEFAGYYVRRILNRMDVRTGAMWQIPGGKRRPTVTFPMGSDLSRTVMSGDPEGPSIRSKAWEVGRRYRSDRVAADAERVYDPGVDSKAIETAFDDLRAFGSEQQRPRIAVVDPYALDEPALQAIIVGATRNGRASVIDIYTEFESGEKLDVAAPDETRREQIKKAALSTAQRLATLAGVKIRFFNAEGLHDRFLMIGEHVARRPVVQQAWRTLYRDHRDARPQTHRPNRGFSRPREVRLRDRMMDARDRILAAAPYGAAVMGTTEPVTTAIVKEALDGLAAGGVRTSQDARILAYACYIGEFHDEAARLARAAGLEVILRRELAAQKVRTYDEPQRLAASIENGGSELSLVRKLADANVGWAFALLHLVRDADPMVVAMLTGSVDDVAGLVSMFWLIGWVPPGVRATVLERLLSANDGLRLACAAQLLADWIRSDILANAALGFDPSTVLPSAPKKRALALFGGLVDDMHRWLSFARLSDTAVERAKQWLQRIDDMGRGIVAAPNDVDKVLCAAGPRDIQALTAMSRWASSPDFDARTGERIAGHGLALFKREFASFMPRDQNDNLYDAAHPEWVISPLVEALSNVGLSVEDFTAAYRGLACDAFSRMARYAAWLRDRPRSLVLLVIAGCVAIRRSDPALLDAVRAAARDIEGQPASDFLMFDAQTLVSLEQQLGFTIPPA